MSKIKRIKIDEMITRYNECSQGVNEAMGEEVEEILTREKLAEKIGTSYSLINNLQAGRVGKGYQILNSLAEVFECSIDELIEKE